MANEQENKKKMATESKANKYATPTCIVQVVGLICLRLLKLATQETKYRLDPMQTSLSHPPMLNTAQLTQMPNIT